MKSCEAMKRSSPGKGMQTAEKSSWKSRGCVFKHAFVSIELLINQFKKMMGIQTR
jgi:hypothetical protein